MDDITYKSAKSIAGAVRRKEVSAVEVVETHLRRIDETNPALNAVVKLCAERALDEARRADAALADGEPTGPLHGVPMTIKDSLDTESVVTTGGTLGRAGFVPERDSTVVARLRRAGAILLGKTNTPELTLAGETDNLVYGRTNNPYDPSRTPGGSSGGAGAVVAAGGSPLDVGSDTGGSIRLPSHFCGIAGLKPNSWRVPRTGHVVPWGLGALDSYTQNGPMARFVEDLVLTLPLMSGPDWIDPAIIDMPLGDPEEVDVSSLRVGFHISNGIMDPTPETAGAVRAAAAALDDTGCTVEEERPVALEMLPDLSPVFEADGRAWMSRLLEKAGTTRTHPWLQERWTDGEPLPVGQFTALLERQDEYRSGMLRFMERFDAILCPVAPWPAPEHGVTRTKENRQAFAYTGAYNVTGWPGAVVRGATSPEGLPIGVQIVARPWREDVALALAARLETALGGWRPASI